MTTTHDPSAQLDASPADDDQETQALHLDLGAAFARAQWTEKAAARLVLVRQKRREALVASKQAIEVATNILLDLRVQHSAELASIGVRRGFYRLNQSRLTAPRDPDPSFAPEKGVANPQLAGLIQSDVRTRPPSGQLVHRPGNAMTLMLTALAAAQIIGQPGKSVRFDDAEFHNAFGARDWSRLIAVRGSSQVYARQHVVAALKRLAQYNLVKPLKQGGWMKWQLLREDGAGRAYKVPKADEQNGILQIPINFWLMGWVHLLTDAEKALYIMLYDAARRMPVIHQADGVGLAQSTRYGEYGITDEVYAASYELEEFGLIRRMPSASSRRAGRVPRAVLDDVSAGRVTLGVERFQILAGLSEPAGAVIEKALTDSRRPPRFDHFASWDEGSLKTVAEAIARSKRR